MEAGPQAVAARIRQSGIRILERLILGPPLGMRFFRGTGSVSRVSVLILADRNRDVNWEADWRKGRTIRAAYLACQ